MQARLAAFMRRQHALRAALAAGRALTKLHHSELSAVCIHAWHAYSSRQAGARRLQQKSSTRVVTKCWNVWVMHVVHARTVDRALASLEASRRRKTLRKVLEGWRGVVLASEKAREDAAVATVKHMHEWRKCTVFVAWVSLTEKHQKLARRFLVRSTNVSHPLGLEIDSVVHLLRTRRECSCKVEYKLYILSKAID